MTPRAVSAPAETLLLLGGAPARGSGGVLEVIDPYRREVVAHVSRAGLDDLDRAVGLARSGQKAVAALPVHARAAILERAAAIVSERREALATEVSRQVGKAFKDTFREAGRVAETLRASADAARHLHGDGLTADAMSGGEKLIALELRVPVGVVGAITPYNSPLNLVAHKLGPALAAGNAIILKPASKAPLSALSLAGILVEAGMPAPAISILPGGPDLGTALVAHAGVDFVTLTGSRRAGEQVRDAAGLKRVTLELGGNSATLVHHDADVVKAAAALSWGAFANAGQSCNSAQRIFVHAAIFDAFAAELARRAAALVVGDPLDPKSDLGTMVDEGEARRVESWVRDAVAAGGRLLCGGLRTGAAYQPTVLQDVPEQQPVNCEEVFGPVAVLTRYDDVETALASANNTPYGLVGAVFTRSLPLAMMVGRRLEAGVVNVNRPPNYRLDHLPYGGVKASGLGREGPRYAVEEMTERRMILIDAEA
ncbi:MAG TPA: aldehyde dehydrogenase family protein [Candidatus Limnocylindrales bacterium]|nr:aldehyde dehydrogenase family protein [Candidatus Limnocylindrales bacterium]